MASLCELDMSIFNKLKNNLHIRMRSDRNLNCVLRYFLCMILHWILADVVSMTILIIVCLLVLLVT